MAIWIIIGLLAVIAGVLLVILWELGRILESVSAMEGPVRSSASGNMTTEDASRTVRLLNRIELHARRLADRHGRDGDPRDYPDCVWDNRDGHPPERPLC